MTQHPNPLDIFTRKQLVGKDDADSIALMVMIHFDAAHRGQCTGAGVNFLTTHLIIASYIAAKLKSKIFHAQVTRAYAALGKAADRPTSLLDLTTGEYQTIRAALKTYLCAMPNVEIGTMNDACHVAAGMMA